MNFNTHSDLVGKHALLGASNYHWLGYDDEKLVNYIRTSNRTTIGTALHEFAASCIKHSVKFGKSHKQIVSAATVYMDGRGYSKSIIDGLYYIPDVVFDTLIAYINDAIGFKMTPEQVLAYTDICFGTADAITFHDGVLRVHDLKTGTIPAHVEQLMIYAALFCLEYKFKPIDISFELRIYQNGEVCIHNPTSEEIQEIVDRLLNAINVIDADRRGTL